MVVVIHLGPVPSRGVLGLLQDVRADQIAHAHRAKLLADHSVTGAEIEDSQRRGGHVVALQLFLQQLADDVGGTAIENVVEQLFVETGDGEDAVVVVEPDLLPGTVEQH